jgi:hypothetical protein
LSAAQRQVLVLLPGISKTLKRKLAKARASFTVMEVVGMTTALAGELPEADTWKKVALLLVARHLIDQLQAVFGPPQIVEETSEPPRSPRGAKTVYQLKIALKHIEPPIWRRIQVEDCSLDELHEHIQAAMGWLNAHLYQFTIGGLRYGDPEFLCKGREDETPPVSSLSTKLSAVVPQGGQPLACEYEYDFDDGWQHEILFEARLSGEEGTCYPLCVQGQRACPPEGVGGVEGYQEYLEAMAEFSHERSREFQERRGRFDVESFDPRAATERMQRGLPARRPTDTG